MYGPRAALFEHRREDDLLFFGEMRLGCVPDSLEMVAEAVRAISMLGVSGLDATGCPDQYRKVGSE